MHRGPREAGDTFLVPQQLKIQRPKFCLVPADGAGREDCKEQTQEGGRRDDFGGQGVLASRGHWRLGSESHVGAHQTEKKKKKSIRVGNGLYDKYGGPDTKMLSLGHAEYSEKSLRFSPLAKQTNENIRLKNGQKIRIDIFLEKTYRMSTGT